MTATASRRTAALLSGTYVALAAADTALAASRSPQRRRLRLLTKPLLMPTLALAFRAATSPETAASGPARAQTMEPRTALRTGTLAAQALSCAGDVALLNKSEPAFLAGLSSFFGAHIAYAGAFGSAGRPLQDREATGGVKAAAAVFALAAPALGWAAGRKSPRLRGPVVAYAGILTSMFATSSRLEPTIAPGARRTVMLGTGLFLTSDSLIGLRQFVLPHPTPLSDGAVMATYTLGQGLIARGVAQAVRQG